RERSRDLLPGWDGSVEEHYSVWVEDADHPDGEDIDYRVTNVEVVSGGDYIDFEPSSDEDGRWWYYRAGNQYGTAKLRVTYEVPEELGGGTDWYEFDLNVSADVYEVRVWWDEEYGDSILPGTTVDLYAQGTHRRDGQQDTDEGLTYEWRLLEGDEAGTLAADPDDPQHATFTAANPSADKMGFDDFVHVRAYLRDGGEGPVADSGWAFHVRNAFCEIFPTSIEGDLGIGQSKEVPFELRSYLWDADKPSSESYTTIDDAQLSFWYDPNCLSITDSEGNEVVDNGQRDGDDEASYPVGTFTITRTGDWDTGINIRAVWEDHGQHRETWGNLWFNRLDYHMWFEGDHDLDAWVTRQEDDSFTDPSNPSKTLEMSDSLADLDGLAIEWTVGTWSNDSYQQTFGPDSGLYSVSGDGMTITADAAAMAEQGVRDLRVIATAKAGGHELCESDGDFWFHLREASFEYERERSRDLLPGWDGSVEEHYSVWVEDADHPDGEDIDYRVTNVEVVSGG
ncbi:MAG: hypothetical protein IKG69_10190, partial [Atopobiaceae bacterium]|nr:hypothetical protein [Atopobiaceae bacterium]